jgi:3-dehydroquinate dehydratase/shikimate dehydrogenase
MDKKGSSMICIVIRGPSLEEAHQQIAKALKYAQLIELRLDLFLTRDYASLKQLQTAFAIPMIFTLRNKAHGGGYTKSEENRLAEILSLAALSPEYIDLENTVPSSFINELATYCPQIKLILSYHNFTETPINLDEIYQEMRKVSAFFYKIAVTAKHSLDALKLLCWAKKRSDNKLISLSMGLPGQITRVLGPLVGTPITYASLEDDNEKALGQLSAKTLIERFHYHFLNLYTRIYGLIGDPVTQSISDETHNSLLRTFGLSAVYVKIQVSKSELASFLHLAKELSFHGLSVTMPLKESILVHVDEIDLHASDIGAVNTLLFHEGRIKGFNTDGIGALQAIEKNVLVRNRQVLIIGAGGAAKAIAYETCKRGGIVTILNRTLEKAQQIANQFQCKARRLEEMEDCAKLGYDILINCTPNALPINPKDLLPYSTVMDIKTKKSEEISLLKFALEKGCFTINGYQMFVEQAIGQFILWFDDHIPVQECRKVLEDEIKI